MVRICYFSFFFSPVAALHPITFFRSQPTPTHYLVFERQKRKKNGPKFATVGIFFNYQESEKFLNDFLAFSFSFGSLSFEDARLYIYAKKVSRFLLSDPFY
jgi:hypothetical protein